MENRLNAFIRIDRDTAASLFEPFDKSLMILGCSLIDNSMSNTGYVITTASGKYFLKLYSNTTDAVETAAYMFLQDQIHIPKLYYYDGSKRRFPCSYAIFQYLEGISLKERIHMQRAYPPHLAFEIGRMCAVLHRRKYAHDAWLDQTLQEAARIPKTDDHILLLLEEKAGEYLDPEIRDRLSKYVRAHSSLFERIGAESVLCHGDINYMNLLFADQKVWMIDFEFAHAGSIYHDIGKFFRTKGPAIQSLIGENIYEAFARGYDSASSSKLPPDWLKLAHLCDIASMLVLINRDHAPREWIADVEHDIASAIR